MPAASPWKSHLPLDIDASSRPIYISRLWELGQIAWPLQKPSECIHSQRRAAFRTSQFSAFDLVTASFAKCRVNERFGDSGQIERLLMCQRLLPWFEMAPRPSFDHS